MSEQIIVTRCGPSSTRCKCNCTDKPDLNIDDIAEFYQIDKYDGSKFYYLVTLKGDYLWGNLSRLNGLIHRAPEGGLEEFTKYWKNEHKKDIVNVGKHKIGIYCGDEVEINVRGPCEHKWDGPSHEAQTYGGGSTSSVTCSQCGMTALSHDMWITD